MNSVELELLTHVHMWGYTTQSYASVIVGIDNAQVKWIFAKLVRFGFIKKLGFPSVAPSSDLFQVWYCPSRVKRNIWGLPVMRTGFQPGRITLTDSGYQLSSGCLLPPHYAHVTQSVAWLKTHFRDYYPIGEIYLRQQLGWFMEKATSHKRPVRNMVSDAVLIKKSADGIEVGIRIEVELSRKSIDSYARILSAKQDNYPIVWIVLNNGMGKYLDSKIGGKFKGYIIKYMDDDAMMAVSNSLRQQ